MRGKKTGEGKVREGESDIRVPGTSCLFTYSGLHGFAPLVGSLFSLVLGTQACKTPIKKKKNERYPE